MPSSIRPRRLFSFLACCLLAAALHGAPIRFEFLVPPSEVKNPFAREIWAEVTTPSGQKLTLPAFYVGRQIYAVHARPDEIGTYRLGEVLESTRGQPATAIATGPHSDSSYENKTRLRLPPVGIDARRPGGFARADGRPFVPFGANVAWAAAPDPVAYYRDTIAAFAAANLNWMRVWMVHWSRTNLDWRMPDEGVPIPPGGIDLAAAERWDALLAAAEERGVYLQIVFQHHGQYSSSVNSSWNENPWNAAHPGGFLKSPSDFFIDPTARVLTALKYRYIVARWGWSPAIFAWELFNEVHWVDAIRVDHREDAVAQWHTDMAKLVRSLDVYAHPITTSTEDLRSPVYAGMDFLQPHLYGANLVAATRTFAPMPPDEKRPVFYGEFGDDHMGLSEDQKKAAVLEPAVMWASLMGVGRFPAQPWEGAKLLATGRLGEIGAVARFFALSGWSRHRDTQPFSAVVTCDPQVPLTLAGAQQWQRRPAHAFTLPLDGREPLELGEWPATFVVPASAQRDGFPDHGTFSANFPRDTTLRVRIAGVADKGGGLRVRIDDAVALEQFFPHSTPFPAELAIPVRAGNHTITVENTGAADWVQVRELDLGIAVPALAALGRRNDRFIALWLRHRTNLLAVTPGPATQGTLVIEDVAAGDWDVTWWDTTSGTAGETKLIHHASGPLRLATPAIVRHAAVVIVRRSS